MFKRKPPFLPTFFPTDISLYTKPLPDESQKEATMLDLIADLHQELRYMSATLAEIKREAIIANEKIYGDVLLLDEITKLGQAIKSTTTTVDDLERQVVIVNNKQYGKPNELGVDPSKPAPTR